MKIKKRYTAHGLSIFFMLFYHYIYQPTKNHRIFIHHKMIIKMVPSIGMIRFDSQRLIKYLYYLFIYLYIYDVLCMLETK